MKQLLLFECGDLISLGNSSQEEWRIFMLPLEFILLSARPVVDMRVVLKEPPKPTAGSTRIVSKLLTLEAVGPYLSLMNGEHKLNVACVCLLLMFSFVIVASKRNGTLGY